MAESGLQIVDDLSGDDVGSGKIGAVFETFAFEPENVEVESVTPSLVLRK